MTTRKEKLAAIEEAIANNAKGKPLVGNLLMPDPTPMAPPIGYKKQPSMIDIIRDQIRRAGEEASRAGFETFDEANDFDVDDDPWPESAHEIDEEVEVPPSVLRERMRAQAELDAKPPAASPQSPGVEGGGEAGGAPKAPPGEPPAR